MTDTNDERTAILPITTVGKVGYLVQITNEALASVMPITFCDPVELAMRQKLRISENLAWCAGLDARLTLAHPALQRVIAHHCHDDEGRYCKGCDAGAYAEDSPEWPCSTIDLILEGLA